MKLFEMEGFLRGKCFPGDMKVNETNAEYLVRKFTELEQKLAESQREFRAADATIENLQMEVEKLAAENVVLKAVQVRIFNSGYQRGHEATVEGYYVDIHQNDMTTYHEDIVAEIAEEQTPATDDFLAEVRAQGVERLANAWYAIANETDPGISISDSSRLKYRQRADDAADFANEIRQEVAQ